MFWGEYMVIMSSDNKRYVDVGTGDILYSVYSTVYVRLHGFRKKVPLAMEFIEEGKCDCGDAEQTARQFNMIRDELSHVPPDQAVYNLHDLSEKAPWEGRLSPVITSCANLYTTEDGKDLLFEIVSILCYISVAGGTVSILG